MLYHPNDCARGWNVWILFYAGSFLFLVWFHCMVDSPVCKVKMWAKTLKEEKEGRRISDLSSCLFISLLGTPAIDAFAPMY